MSDQVMSDARAKARRKQVLMSMLRVLEGTADEAERQQVAETARRIDAEDISAEEKFRKAMQ